MTRSDFDTFSMALAPGWRQTEEEASYSDPAEGSRTMFSRRGGEGSLYVSLLPIRPDDPPSESPEHVEGLARNWGRARGIAAPLVLTWQRREDGVLAFAEYKLADDYVAVWYLSNGEATLHASYTSGWRAREEERAARDAMIASLSFG